MNFLDRNTQHKTERGLEFLATYDYPSGDLWIKLADQWYFRSGQQGFFERFIEGVEGHQLTEGKRVTRDDEPLLLEKLNDAKSYYILNCAQSLR